MAVGNRHSAKNHRLYLKLPPFACCLLPNACSNWRPVRIGMREYDFLRVIGATILAAGVAVMTQDPSFRFLPDAGSAGTEATFSGFSPSDLYYRELMGLLKQDPTGDKSRQFKGDLQRQWVRFTDTDLSEMDGNPDRFLAKIKERYEDRQDEIRQWVAEWYRSGRS